MVEFNYNKINIFIFCHYNLVRQKMGCLKIYEENHEGKIIKMSKKDKKSKTENTTFLSKIKFFFKETKATITTLIFVGGFVGSIILIYYKIDTYFDKKFKDIDERFDDCSTKKDIENLETEISIINNFLYGKDGVDRQLEDINKVLQIQPVSTEYIPNLAIDEITIEKNDLPNSTAPYNPNTVIGTDNNGNVYIAQEYINETIFLTYTENNKEIYFLGQYNENYHWDGYCVTNAYNSDGTLYSICESNFVDGERQDYKSFYQDSGNWIYSNRTCSNENKKDKENSVNESKKYKFVYNSLKNFTKTNVRVSDIKYVDEFINKINPILISYYYGNTSGGKYNDNTNTAYLIDYFDDGTVRMLYYGNFKNGYPNDDTGNAWYIVKAENTDYMYYKGYFGEDGNTLNNPGYKFENNLSIDRINEILKQNNCNLDLKWKQ